MRTLLRDADIVALNELRELRCNGVAPSSLSAEAVSKLLSHRFAAPDEYGGVVITERGQQHLRDLALAHYRRRGRRNLRPDPPPRFF